jgi:uncharacterized protein (UPF0332 family)
MEQHNDVGTKWDLACYRMGMAHDDLDCAKRMYEGKFYRFANNRAYYAIFHAVSAIHALDGKAYRKHKDAINNFNKNYIRTEIFPKEFGRRIIDAEEIRHASDYDDFYLASKDETARQMETACELVNLIEEYIKMHR